MQIECRLAADRGHVLHALKTFGKLVRQVKPKDRALIGFDGACLTLEAQDARFFAHATGSWPGTAIVGATLVHALATAPPADDPIVVSCDGEHLQFGPLKVACKWEPISETALSRPALPEWMEAIALKYTLPRARIAAEGCEGELKAAERHLAAVVQRAARSLSPTGVTIEDVTALVEKRLAQRYGGSQ